MLDNFDLDSIRSAVQIVAGKIPLEVSGGVTLNTIKEIASTGIQYVSVGSLTHSAPILNLSLQVDPSSNKWQ